MFVCVRNIIRSRSLVYNPNPITLFVYDTAKSYVIRPISFLAFFFVIRINPLSVYIDQSLEETNAANWTKCGRSYGFFYIRGAKLEIHAATFSSPSSLCRFPDGASAASPSSALDRFPLPLIAGTESNLTMIQVMLSHPVPSPIV